MGRVGYGTGECQGQLQLSSFLLILLLPELLHPDALLSCPQKLLIFGQRSFTERAGVHLVSRGFATAGGGGGEAVNEGAGGWAGGWAGLG